MDSFVNCTGVNVLGIPSNTTITYHVVYSVDEKSGKRTPIEWITSGHLDFYEQTSVIVNRDVGDYIVRKGLYRHLNIYTPADDHLILMRKPVYRIFISLFIYALILLLLMIACTIFLYIIEILRYVLTASL